MSAAQIAAQSLHGASRSGGGWIACCPAHDDKNPSLSLRDGEDGALLVHCFAGCEAKVVLAALRDIGVGHAVNPRTDTPPAPRKRDMPEYVRRLSGRHCSYISMAGAVKKFLYK